MPPSLSSPQPGSCPTRSATAIARAFDAPRLHQVRQPEERGDRRAFRPLAHHGRADRRDADQHVHVEPDMPQRRDGARDHRPQPESDRQAVGGQRRRCVRVIVAGTVSEQRLGPGVCGPRLGGPSRQHQRAAQGDPDPRSLVMRAGLAVRGVIVVHVLAPFVRVHAEPGAADQRDDGLRSQARSDRTKPRCGVRPDRNSGRGCRARPARGGPARLRPRSPCR